MTSATAALAFDLVDRRATPILAFVKLLLRWLSLLLLVAAPLAVAFMAWLIVSELTSFWNAKYSVVELVATAGGLIFLVNAHYQDGTHPANHVPLLLQARLVSALAVIPIVLIATIRLGVLVAEFGWVPREVVVLVELVVLSCYAFGFVAVTVRSGFGMRGLATVNAVAAIVMVCLTTALLSPIADPARLSVADQLDRLASGKIAPDKFPFLMLRFEGARYGWEALERLKNRQEGPDASVIAAKAAAALEAE